MRASVVKELGIRIIKDICEIGMTPEEVAATFDAVIESIEASIIYETVSNIVSGGVVEEAEQIIEEAFDNVDKHSGD